MTCTLPIDSRREFCHLSTAPGREPGLGSKHLVSGEAIRGDYGLQEFDMVAAKRNLRSQSIDGLRKSREQDKQTGFRKPICPG
jgi:hypothetical protein